MKNILVYWRTLFWSVIMLVLFLVPAQDLPGQKNIPNLDKIAHIVLFMVFTIFYLLDRLKLRDSKTIVRGHIAVTFLYILLFAVTVEFLQKIMGFGRAWDIKDIFWDVIGFILGLIFVVLYTGNRSKSL
jgi:VanZ family protein